MSTPTPRWSTSYLAALAVAAVPGLDAVATRHPRTVTEHLEVTGVLDSAGRAWVVRAPRDDATGAALALESALLAALEREDLPFDLARTAGWVELDDGGRAVVQTALPGRPLVLAALHAGPGVAADLGAALAALHRVPLDTVSDLVPVYDAEACRTRLLAELDALAATGRVPAVLLRRWEHALEDVALWRFSTTFVHGDLASDRVLVEGEEVVALEDFAQAHVGDPAVDLAWLVAAAPEDALESVLEAYALGAPEGDAHALDRAQLLSELALGRWLQHGLRVSEPQVVAEAEEMLADLAEAVTAVPDED
ncbi:aminoglycoside phosphotransferase [Miniimonas arenae]|uniref:Aminoglycoside phosphotransferase n=1 Tax=Miniimonas arenae TaxID=676201 RepID=A0A5C5BEJ5_9MICO|nr:MULTISPECIES: phosphotransferase [Miniimonas]TNU76008.1 aminoglycoside phosphotransferase [Miniimonas arenae]